MPQDVKYKNGSKVEKNDKVEVISYQKDYRDQYEKVGEIGVVTGFRLLPFSNVDQNAIVFFSESGDSVSFPGGNIKKI